MKFPGRPWLDWPTQKVLFYSIEGELQEHYLPDATSDQLTTFFIKGGHYPKTAFEYAQTVLRQWRGSQLAATGEQTR